ncbi:AMP-binding protein [Sporosarcina sp. 179-K 3D1 HS]|uniref:AMP-binding protein n=1 Tax=Sporosarcina sp. 179-K 3D1 HS TaxID=3232169 RepID=UPI0039A31544
MGLERTLPVLLTERASKEKNEVALRQKYLGIWNEITWGDYYEKVEQLALALSDKFHFKKGEILAIIGENKPQWLYSQMATQVLEGISVGIYQESLPEQIVYYLNDSKARIVIAEDQEQVDKLLEIEEQIPLVEHIIYYNPQGMRYYNHPKLVDFDELLTLGSSLAREKPGFFRTQTERSLGKNVAVIAYSAATTGNPKGVMLTHDNLIAAAESLIAIDQMTKKDDYFSFLPLSWIHEKVLSTVIPLITGTVVNFPEKPHTVIGDLREIGPQTLMAPPRVYQTLMSNFTIRMEGSTWFKKKVFNLFKKYGDRVAEAKLNNRKPSGGDQFMFKLGDFLVFSAIRDHLGLSRTKRAYVAGAALQPEAFHFYHSIGLNLKQTYGGTEFAGIAFVHHDGDIRAGSTGIPLPNTEVRVEENGDIYVKNPAIFSEYLNEEDRKMVVDGWISIGDCGRMDDDGHLYILDRQEDIITALNGKTVYPRIIENTLKSSPYIQEAVCYGKDRPYMTAILNVDLNSVGRWADKNRIIYTEYSDLSRHPQVVEFIEREVTKLMSNVPPEARVRKFAILHKQFNANDGELTRTLKVRRKFIEDKYKSLLDGMYTDSLEVMMTESDREAVEEISLQVIQLKLDQEVA